MGELIIFPGRAARTWSEFQPYLEDAMRGAGITAGARPTIRREARELFDKVFAEAPKISIALEGLGLNPDEVEDLQKRVGSGIREFKDFMVQRAFVAWASAILLLLEKHQAFQR
ncbi:hypothetical protein [Pseudomonas sp. BMS12]|uniref:hypothetical protein n=1 Tax=Pseudomonas sp. BMS12 TaxID=1796033 RepID=UPI00083AB30F|nr:hypothetical protein [Pseudomonas sp. BMS12]